MSDAAEPAQIAVIGGGIAGTALAYYLAREGAEGVVLLERGQLGDGMTGASFAGVRQQFSTAAEIELSKRGLAFWKNCQEELSSPCPFWRFGYLFVTSRADVMARLAAAAALQRKLGAGPVELLKAGEAGEVAPWRATADLAGGTSLRIQGKGDGNGFSRQACLRAITRTHRHRRGRRHRGAVQHGGDGRGRRPGGRPGLVPGHTDLRPRRHRHDPAGAPLSRGRRSRPLALLQPWLGPELAD